MDFLRHGPTLDPVHWFTIGALAMDRVRREGAPFRDALFAAIAEYADAMAALASEEGVIVPTPEHPRWRAWLDAQNHLWLSDPAAPIPSAPDRL